MNDTLINKQRSVMRCVRRARESWNKPSQLPVAEDYDKQDLTVLNLLRAREQCIDMATHFIRLHDLGWPNETADCFKVLAEARVIDDALADKLVKMVGFRNRAVHEYQGIDYAIVAAAVTADAEDLLKFAARVVAAAHSDG